LAILEGDEEGGVQAIKIAYNRVGDQMANPLKTLHRFLTGQLFYPILLSTILALSMYLFRVYITQNSIIYFNLVWNIGLAWIPYLCSLAAIVIARAYPHQWWLLILPGMLWLIFFPNAPYILTDFLHLDERPSIPLWYDILMLVSFAWTGLFLAITSLRTMQILVRSYLGWSISWIFVALALGLSGLGIYLGRFERWNSWDLFFHPKTIAKDVAIMLANPLDNLRFVGFTILYTAFLFVCYLTFISVRRMDEFTLEESIQ
jgi:uncharacterized membrane protein